MLVLFLPFQGVKTRLNLYYDEYDTPKQKKTLQNIIKKIKVLTFF